MLYGTPNKTGFKPPKPPATSVGNGPNRESLYSGTRPLPAASSVAPVTPGSDRVVRGPYAVGPKPAGGPTAAESMGPAGMTRTQGPSSLAEGYNPARQMSYAGAPLSQENYDFYNKPGVPPRRGLYDDTRPMNAPAPEGWPQNMPRPPDGVLPGTEAWNRWLEHNGIDGRSPLNYQIQHELTRQGMGYVDPTSVSPWGDAGGYTDYVADYLNQMGLGAGQAPDAFRQDLYDQTYGGIMADARAGAGQAANMIGDFNAEDTAHFGVLNDYMKGLYDEELGGFSGFDYRGQQEAGIAQAEIARASAEDAMSRSLAGTGLSGQANSVFASAPIYRDYMANRISAMTDPAMRAAELGIEGANMAAGNLTDLYGLESDVDAARASVFSDLYGRGLSTAAGTAADIGLGAGSAGLQAFLQMQDLYSGMPLEGYNAALQAAMAKNAGIDSLYGTSLERESRAKDRRAQRRAEDRQRYNDIANNMGMTVDTIMGGMSAGGLLPSG